MSDKPTFVSRDRMSADEGMVMLLRIGKKDMLHSYNICSVRIIPSENTITFHFYL